MRVPALFVFFTLLLPACQQEVPVDLPKADFIFTGDNIITMDEKLPTATAVVVHGEKIVWVGDREQIADWVGEDTIIEDLGDSALLPGFIDAHGHFSGVAAIIDAANVSSPPVGEVTDIVSLQANLNDYISEKQFDKGAWVIGWGYDDSLLAEKRHPTRVDLDQVSTDNPIALIHTSAHLFVANSMALEILNITAHSEDPAGGIIRREENSHEPNGVLEENAGQAVLAKLGQEYPITAESINKAQRVYAEYGITTVQEGGQSTENLAMFQDAADQGAFFVDFIAYQWVTPESAMPDPAIFGHYRNRMKLGGVKVVLDGSPQGKTAYLTEPYLVPPYGQNEDYRGYPRYPDAEVNQIVGRSLKAGIPLLTHANGDAAIDQLLNAVTAAGIRGDHRTTIIHAQTIREDQLDKVAELEMIPSFFSAHSFYWGDWHRDSVLGETRATRISPVKSAIDRNIVFTLHNDAPIVPPDMMRLLGATVNRETRSGKVLGADQRVSIMDALKGITIQAAYQYFEEAEKGSLTTGKQADLVILERNPLTVPAAEIKDIKITRTLSRGKVIFTGE